MPAARGDLRKGLRSALRNTNYRNQQRPGRILYRRPRRPKVPGQFHLDGLGTLQWWGEGPRWQWYVDTAQRAYRVYFGRRNDRGRLCGTDGTLIGDFQGGVLRQTSKRGVKVL